MHKRDVAILALSFFAVYFSLQREGAFSFEPAWSFPLDDDVLSSGETALPPPVVVDLNGDGRREVLVATRDARLLVLEQPTASDPTGFASARILAQASLLPARVRVASGRRAVAVSAGHLDAHGGGGGGGAQNGTLGAAPRKSVVAVLTAGWTVMCFDHNLRLLWEHALGADFPQGWAPREVAVLVTSATLKPGDRGAVFVAASAARPDAGEREGGEDALEEESAWEGRLARGRRSGSGAAEAALDAGAGVDATHHVNYYAFEGRTGALRWKHESGDFHRDTDTLADSLQAQHSYRLDAAALVGRHYGQVECREYREAVLAALPHAWARPADTRLRVAHWAKHRHAGARGRGAGDAVPGVEHATNAVAEALGRAAAAATGRSSSSGGDNAGAASQQGPRSALPNVLVAHLREGIEAVHLESGRTVCKLLLAPGGLHADVNADGVVDHVTAEGWRPGHAAGGAATHAPRCTAVVTSGVPARAALFNGSVCRGVGVGAAGARGSSGASWEGGDAPGGTAIEVAPPAALPRADAARPGAPQLRQRADAAFLNSKGEVSAFGADGRRHFQVRTDAGWTPHAAGAPPTLAPLLLRAGSRAAVLLAAGERAAAVLSPAGTVLAHLPLPAAPVAPLQPADLGGDGVAGLLLRTPGALYAYRQRQHAGALPFAFLLGVLMLAMAAAVLAHAQHGGGVRGTDAVLVDARGRAAGQRTRDD